MTKREELVLFSSSSRNVQFLGFITCLEKHETSETQVWTPTKESSVKTAQSFAH